MPDTRIAYREPFFDDAKHTESKPGAIAGTASICFGKTAAETARCRREAPYAYRQGQGVSLRLCLFSHHRFSTQEPAGAAAHTRQAAHRGFAHLHIQAQQPTCSTHRRTKRKSIHY